VSILEKEARRLFDQALTEREGDIKQYLLAKPQFEPKHIGQLARAYIERGGKRLRPAVLLFSFGAAGGKDEAIALPAAAGIEVVHTWTLTHDDLIDHDGKRRGEPTVHVLAAEKARTELEYDERKSAEYGERIAILVGDVQHAWSVSLFLETQCPPIDPGVIGKVVHLLESEAVPKLIEGETLDVQYEEIDVERLSRDEIKEMLYLKTGALYKFAAQTGAMLGLNCADRNHKVVQLLASFASQCGTAFQLQDDILGIVGNEKKLGKPVGSDIREGKRTTILWEALRQAEPPERKKILQVVGNPAATEREVQQVTDIFRKPGGGVDCTESLAQECIDQALPFLDDLRQHVEKSEYLDLLSGWADYMIHREY
jgi:geranylgeranyl diphosphate synthase, type I